MSSAKHRTFSSELSLLNIPCRVIDDSPSTKEPGEEEEEDLGEDGLPVYRPKYNIEFTFDTDVRVAITIYYFATEEISNGQAM